jgi:hypothetical protein
MRRLQWHKNGDGTWLASASRANGGRYQITVREFADGRVFDVHRLVRTGPDVWRPSGGQRNVTGVGAGHRHPSNVGQIPSRPLNSLQHPISLSYVVGCRLLKSFQPRLMPLSFNVAVQSCFGIIKKRVLKHVFN